MSYPGLINEHPYDLKEREHIEYHQGEHIFETECAFCVAEKCPQCAGRGMTEDCNKICKRCDGRGRIL